jgi:hypothetical protein
MELVYGAGSLDRPVRDVERLLREWRIKEGDRGQLYLEHESATPSDRLFVEDLAVTMLVNSLVSARAAEGIARHGQTLDLSALPQKPLEETTDEERHLVASIVATVATWPGISASVASKTLHKKRPALIPILDNRAIFEAYLDPRWPDRHTVGESVKDLPRIRRALDAIAYDLTRHENASVWPKLREADPQRSRIELFDMVWWMHFREIEPVSGVPPGAPVVVPKTVDAASSPDAEPAPPRQFRIQEFRDDDAGYRSWLYANLGGFVVNAAQRPAPGYLVLHRATCETITPTPDKAWTKDYSKVCSGDRYELEAWARSLGGRLRTCERCDP